MPPRIALIPVTDFTGGLNLRANAFQVRGSESPDMLNVDLDPRGGFAMRNVLFGVNEDPLPGAAESIIVFTTMNQATKQLLVNVGTALYYTTGDEFTTISLAGLTTARTVGGRHRGAIYNDVLYFGNGVDKSMTWTGSVITDRTDPGNTGGAYAPDYANPAAAGENDLPIGKCFASHYDMLFIANLTTGHPALPNEVQFPNRIRWSHPGHPMAWRSQDYIDIDTGHDGDYITAIIPFNERLFIFKNNSIHVLSGYSANTFSVSLITDKVGAPSQEAVVASEDALYFWHSHTGAYGYKTRTGVEWLFERLYPDITEGNVLSEESDQITVGWVKNRLWCNVVRTSGTTANHAYVYDPTLSAVPRGQSIGGWTQYDVALGPILEWSPPLTAVRWVAALANSAYVVDLEKAGDQDAWGAESVTFDGVNDEVSAPDSAPLSIVGDLDISCKVAPANWLPTTANTLIAKWSTGGDQRGYMLQVMNTTGFLRLSWSELGTAATVITATSTVATGGVNNEPLCVRATLDVDNGAVGNDVTFYTSEDGEVWTQLGDVVTTAATTVVYDNTSRLYLGAHSGVDGELTGDMYWATITDGIGGAGTVVGNPDFSDDLNTTVTATVDTAGPNTWTYTGATLVGGSHPRDIESYYVTRWFDDENPAQLKRWKRPEFVYERAFTSVLNVNAYKDYNPATATRSFTITPDAGINDGASLWGTAWGTMVWASDNDSGGVQIEKGQTLGRCRSVRLKISGPSTSVRWAISAITFKYIGLRIRG